MDQPAPTVFVVDDDKAVRESLAWLIHSVGLEVRTFESARQFLERYDGKSPGCLVLDVRLPGMSGLELHDKLIADGIDLPTIMITGHGDVSIAVRAMKAGAIDFIEKPFSDQILLDRIRLAIHRGEQFRTHSARRATILSRTATLTLRERQVMDLVIKGRLNKQIALELGLSQKTIEVHRARVMEKMQAGSLAELVRMAMQVEPPPQGVPATTTAAAAWASSREAV